MEETETTQADVIGKRLTILGIIGAVVVGVVWFAQKQNHEDAFGTELFEQDPFNSTPYLIALGVAAAVFVVGLIVQTGKRD